MQIPVSEKISWIGANDRQKALFENLWPLPQGVAYNAYLIDDEKTALVDTIDATVAGDFLDRIAAQLNGRPLDYLIINHMEPDHSAMIGALARQYPEMQVVGNKKTFKMLDGFFGITRNLMEVTDGSLLSTGRHQLQFLMTPWVHWPETMMTYDTTEQILFSGDVFGAFGTLDGGLFDDEGGAGNYEDEARRYFSNIVGQYSNMVQKALAKLHGLPIRMIAPTHGRVWRSRPARVIEWYDRWSRHEALPGVVVAFASMYGNTGKMADAIARCLAEQGLREIQLFDVSKTHLSFLLSEIWKYRGIVLGSCTYNNHLHPMMAQLCDTLTHVAPKNKSAAAFGSGSWNGGAARLLQTTMAALGWSLAGEAIEIIGAPTEAKLSGIDALAQALARQIER
jgi:flavorubredoxin